MKSAGLANAYTDSQKLDATNNGPTTPPITTQLQISSQIPEHHAALSTAAPDEGSPMNTPDKREHEGTPPPLTMPVSPPLTMLVSPPAQQSRKFCWDPHEGNEFFSIISNVYEEVIHWRRNVFLVPSGSTGKAFVSEVACLFQAYGDSSSLESIAMKTITVLRALLLQKPSHSSKSGDHVTHLQRRLDLWLKGDIQALTDEGRCMHNTFVKQLFVMGCGNCSHFL